MFDTSDLKAARDAGILSREQFLRLEAFLVRRRDPSAGGENESLRFLANFNDIFITIGIIILAVGLTALTAFLFAPSLDSLASSRTLSLLGSLVLLPVAGVMWLLAEYFCGHRRLLLPSMALSLIISVYVGLSFGMIASGLTGKTANTIGSFFEAWNVLGNAGVTTFTGIAGTALLIFMRFKLPFALFILAVSVAGAAYAFMGFFGDIGLVLGGAAFFVVGVMTLALAVAMDATDPQRMSIRSDAAFWLHVAAAPQLIWGVRSLIVGSGIAMPNAFEASIIVGLLLVLACLSLALNRRALIVSGLLTFATALGRIVEAAGGGVTTTLIATTLLLGTGVIFLGGGWHSARRLVLSLLPDNRLLARVFPKDIA